MARKKVLDLDADQTIQFEKAGQQFEGFYIGSKKVKSDYGLSNFHIFQNDNGNQGIFGSSKLDSKLATVPAGHMTYITYGGKVKIPGGKTMHKYEVEWDDELSIDVEGVQVNIQASEEPTDEEVGAAPESDDIDEVEAAAVDEESEELEEDEVVQTKTPKALSAPRTNRMPAATPSKAAQDRVSSLLSKKR